MGGVFIQDLLKENVSSCSCQNLGRGQWPNWPDSNGPVQVDLVIPVEPCVEKLLLSVECFCKEVHTVKERIKYLLTSQSHS